MQVRLRQQTVYPWHCSGQTCVRGFVFYAGRRYAAADLATLVETLEPEAVASFLHQANGVFCVLCRGPRASWMAVDRLRAFPLFYGQPGNELYAGDDPDWIAEQLGGVEINPLSRDEYRATSYVTGPHTLYKGVRQVQGGEFLQVGDGTAAPLWAARHYFRFRPTVDPTPGASEEDLLDRHDVLMEAVARRLIECAQGRPLVIPLSGGFDSRLICLMLRRLGYEDVICFTYGRPANEEATVSAAVAQQVGYRWEFVPYTEERWQQWVRTPEWRAYMTTMENAVSAPHVQDWPAVWELHAAGLIPRDSIFVPGHAADFLTGSHIPREFLSMRRVGVEKVVDKTLSYHYSLLGRGAFPASRWQDFRRKVREVLGDAPAETPAEAVSASDLWDGQERQCKFTCNSARVYEFWGYEWLIPLWDTELTDFWLDIPLAYRAHNVLYNTYVKRVEQRMGFTHVTRSDAAYIEQPLRKLVRNTVDALPPFVRRGINWARGHMRVARWQQQYYSHPLAWFGVATPEEFRSVYRTGNESVVSLLVSQRFGA